MAFVALSVLALGAVAGKEASDGTAYSETSFLLRQASLSDETLMSNMTFASALKAVGSKIKDKTVLELINARLEHGHDKKKRSGLRGQALDPSGYSGVEQAKEKLNEMILESEQKLDLEMAKCEQYDVETKAVIEETRQDIATYNAVAANARAQILAAMTTIEIIETKLPEIHHVLKVTLDKCATDLATLRSQLAIVESDLEVMGIIIDMTQCSDTSSMLLQCEHPSKKAKASTSFITLSHSRMRVQLAQLKSATVRQQVQEALYDSTYHANRNFTTEPPGAMDVNTEVDTEKAVAKCTVAGSPNCPLLRDRFLDITAGIGDKRDELKRLIAKTEAECEETSTNLKSQIADFETRLKKEQTALAEATEAEQEATEQSRLKQSQLTKLMTEWEIEMERCKEYMIEIRTEICGLKKIRQEVMKIQGQNIFLQDCEVSKWITTECSVTCGGGLESLFRNIIVQSNGGAACPPLTMERPCSMTPCPIDCEVSSWSDYSTCSAKCGGGVQMRSREVLTQPQYGGVECGATSENRPCGVESCDKDCELSDWSEYSGCSKACGGGFQESKRTVTMAAEGQGTCPHEDSELRLRFKPCNEHACEPEGVTLVCTAKLDVLILIDGSASLGDEGWAASLKAGETLAKAFKGGENASQVGAILFSGPRTYGQYYACMDGTQTSLEDECGIKWVEHFTYDTEGLATKIAALEFPAASTFTSMALATAEADLRNGRDDAESIVIVITDGRPLSTTRTFQAAEQLRAKARLMWVPVGNNVPIEDMESWASLPVRDNMIVVEDFSTLESPELITKIIADACATVE